MTRKKEERKVKNAKRKIWLKAGIYPDFSRLCHRSGECLAVPVYITGKYGGAAFVLIYLVFLVLLGLPIMVMEFAVGRASQASVAMSFDRLEATGNKMALV